MKSTVLGIRSRISEIRKALDNKMFISALSLSLTIPDICGKLENISGNDKEKYIKWFDNNVASQYVPEIVIEDDDLKMGEKRSLTGIRCYGLRCAVLHSGNEKLDEKHMDLDNNYDYEVGSYKLVLFDDPEDEMLYLSGNDAEKVYKIIFYLNIRKFCERICLAAEKTVSNLSMEEGEKYSIELLQYEHR